MHILFLTQIIPYPPDSGPKVKTWHVLRYLLGRGDRVTLISFVRPEEEQHIPALRAQGLEVIPVPMRRSPIKDIGYLGRSLVSGESFLIVRDNLAEFRKVVQEQVEQNKIDVIHADQLTMAQFATVGQNGRQPARIFDAHNAVWTIVERMADNLPWFLRPLAKIETGRVLDFETNTVKEFEHTLAVSEIDRSALLSALDSETERSEVKSKITVIPIAVDTQQLQPLQRQEHSKRIVTLGTLHYPPNADGIRWFVNEVFPHVLVEEPGAHLTIIGKNPPADFLEQAEQNAQHLRVTGYVEELDPYLAEAAIMVVPVRAGGGMRVRILEAFARGMPVVTTTVGLEGIDAQDGQEVIVRDDPVSFARAVVDLLRHPERQAQLAETGRRLAVDRYDWQAALKTLDGVYDQIERRNLQGGMGA